MIKRLLIAIFILSMTTELSFADNSRARNDIRNLRNENGRSSSNNGRVDLRNNRGRQNDNRRNDDRQNARDRMRDFFCSRSGRCRPGDPQVDELSTMAMGLSALGFVSIVLYRERREKFEIKNDNS